MFCKKLHIRNFNSVVYKVYIPRGVLVLRAVLGLVIGLFVLTNWHLCREWAESWAVQKRILAGLRAKSAALPEGATVILSGPYHIGDDPDRAPIFMSHWGFTSALRLAVKRRDLSGDVFGLKMRFGPDGLYAPREGKRGNSLAHSYENLFYYDYGKDRLSRLTARSRPAK